jgi:lysozyme
VIPRATIIPALMKDEGFRSRPYRCTRGKLTIGYGTNIEDGIEADEAMFLLEYRVDKKIAECLKAFPWFAGLDPVRQGVVVRMAYQLGTDGVAGFRRFCAAMARGDYNAAADEMLDSKWYREDTPARAMRESVTMRSGQ